MPFIMGYGYIPAISVTANGDFVFDSTPDYPTWYMAGPSHTGELTYIYDCASNLELFNSNGNTPMGSINVINLPVDFQVHSIVGNTAHGFAYLIPTPGIIINAADIFVFEVSGISSDIPGWDGKPETWDESFRNFLYDPFTIAYTITIDDATPNLVFGDDENATGYEGIYGYPTNVLRFFFSGTFDEGVIPEKPTNPEFEPYPDAISVTPGDGTENLVITIPGEPDEVIPVTPGVRITIPLPPNTPVVTITPTSPGGTGPALNVPVAMVDQDEGFVLDLALSMTIQILGDPSGIYTIVPGQFHDDLYEHATSPDSSVEVPIPRPFGTTSYIPEGND